MFRIFTKNDYCKQSKRMLLCLKQESDFAFFCFKYKSHYTSLGLNSNASQKEIKSAYYELSLKFHPDKNKGSLESVEKFREITAAYEVLGNTEKKRQYDQDLNFRHSESDWRNQHYSPRSSDFKTRTAPRTGKSKHYDYEEHYRQHYEEYNRQRQADHDYYKHRWEADYRRRYPYGDENIWSNYRRRQTHPPPVFRWKFLFLNKAFIYFMTLWFFMFLISLPILDMDNPRKVTSKTIYYKTDKDKKESDKIENSREE